MAKLIVYIFLIMIMTPFPVFSGSREFANDDRAAPPNAMPEFSQTTLLTNDIYSETLEFPAKIVSVLWEGREILGSNTASLERLRRSWPDLRLIHFISPAYFSRAEEQNIAVAKKIKALVLPDEKICLLVHPWESILKNANVDAIKNETFWGYHLDNKRCLNDCGQEVPFNSYDLKDREKIIGSSLAVFKKYMDSAPSCFMAGAWLSGKDLWPILRKLGIKHDFSYVDISLLKEKLFKFPLWNYLIKAWGKEQTFSPKKFLVLTEFGALNIWPMSAATVSYNSPEKIGSLYQKFKNSTASKETNSDKREIFHVGFYMDTLGRYENEVNKILLQVK